MPGQTAHDEHLSEMLIRRVCLLALRDRSLADEIVDDTLHACSKEIDAAITSIALSSLRLV